MSRQTEPDLESPQRVVSYTWGWYQVPQSDMVDVGRLRDQTGKSQTNPQCA